MVGHVNAFLEIALASVPDLLCTLRPACIRLDRDGETRTAERLYDQILPMDFSKRVLAPAASQLVTMPLGETEWNDLGDPDRVISTLLASELELPGWATRWRREAAVQRLGKQPKSCAVA